MRLLAEFIIKLENVDSISFDTVRQVLKKNEIKPWQKKEWCIPKEANAEFVCNMEEVLEVYKRPIDPTHPVVCMDCSHKQQVKEICQLMKAEPGKIERYDYEYERNGGSQLFMFF